MTDLCFVRAAAGSLSCELGEGVVLLDPTNCLYFGLNRVAAHIWRLVARPTTIESIHQSLLAEFATDSQRCRQDLLAFLDSAIKARLVEAVDVASA